MRINSAVLEQAARREEKIASYSFIRSDVVSSKTAARNIVHCRRRETKKRKKKNQRLSYKTDQWTGRGENEMKLRGWT
jgi:hypothetical protein